jgi:hypothetical protein
MVSPHWGHSFIFRILARLPQSVERLRLATASLTTPR